MSGTFERGTTIGSYRILRRIGSGAMGTVYEVEHDRLGVRYALKSFSFEGTDAEFRRKRFLAEGRLLARLDHPRIVRVYDMDVSDCNAWFTMDYIAGPKGVPETLADMPRGGTLPETTLKDWYEDVREALEAVHLAGIVHRDVKLENILVDRNGRAVLSDFGVSRVVDEKLRRELEVTRTMVSSGGDVKVVLGTAAYLAPEIRHGGEPTPAADLYALGIAFFRLLTGLWYEPGPHAFDLLEPFDRQWRPILSALLSEDPANRRAMAFLRKTVGKSDGLWWRCLLCAALSAVLTAAVFLLLRENRADVTCGEPCENHTNQLENVQVEDVFSIPDVIR